MECSKAELALRAILKAKGAKGFTTNFDDLGDVDVEKRNGIRSDSRTCLTETHG